MPNDLHRARFVLARVVAEVRELVGDLRSERRRLARAAHGLDTLAEFPMIQNISDVSSRDSGKDVEPIRKLAENLHRAVGKRRAQKETLPIVTAAAELNVPAVAVRLFSATGAALFRISEPRACARPTFSAEALPTSAEMTLAPKGPAWKYWLARSAWEPER